MVKSHGLDQRDVLRCVPRFEVFFGIALRIINLRKPFAQIDSMTQMRRAPLRESGILGALCRARARRQSRIDSRSESYCKKGGGRGARPMSFLCSHAHSPGK